MNLANIKFWLKPTYLYLIVKTG
ncbi:MAG: DUF4408 domain-containing protein [Chryseobacterium cucumeris]|nr:MAG: DUF4408 domain-containing protein [Chryseobacterium cucumeris]